MNNPKLYQETNQLQKHNAAEIVKEYSEKFLWRSDGLDTLIDVGSAIGDVLMDTVRPLMGKEFQRIVCSDISPQMVEYAKINYEGKVANSEFKQFDIGAESVLPDDLRGQFDHVLSFFCLQLVPNQRQAFQNIYTLLRPDGGDCLLTIFARAPYYDAYQSLSKTSKWSPFMQDVDNYTCRWHYAKDPQQTVHRLLEEIGFCDIKVKLRKTVYVYESFEAFKYNMNAISHYVHRIPASMHEHFIDDFAEAMINANLKFKHFDEEQKTFSFPYEQLVIYACRKATKDERNGAQKKLPENTS